MANIKHYSDFGGRTVQLVGDTHGMYSGDFSTLFPGVQGIKCTSFGKQVGYAAGSSTPLPVTHSVREEDARLLG